MIKTCALCASTTYLSLVTIYLTHRNSMVNWGGMNDTPKSLLAAVRYFSDPRVFFETMLGAKYPDGKIVCPKCGADKVGVVRSRSLLQCKAAKKKRKS